MSSIHYTIGDATDPQGLGAKIIVHVCNDIGGWGRGFVVAVSRRWSEPEADFRRWYAGRKENDFALGAVRFVPVAEELWVANLIGQHGLRREGGKPPVRYDAIRQGLKAVATFAQDKRASVHMPRIGCGLAGGDWAQVEILIDEELIQAGIPVTVYDLPV